MFTTRPWYLRYAEGDDGGSGGSGSGDKGWTPPASQEEFNRIIQERVGRERSKYGDYSDLKAKADRLDQIEQQGQSETQKLTAERDSWKSKAEALQRQFDRQNLAKQVAREKKIDDPDLLVGDTEEEMKAFADKLLAFRGPKGDEEGNNNEQQQQNGGRKPGYVPTAGTGGAAPTKTGVSAGRDWFAETHKQKS